MRADFAETGKTKMGTALRWAATAAAVFAAGCAAGGGSGADGGDAAGPPSLAAGDARICFYRETWHALSVQPDVTVNGQIVGRALPNAWFCVDRKPGTYDISTVSEPDRKFSAALKAGETRWASLEFTVTWFLIAHINPVPVDEAVGRRGSAGLHYRAN
jgi:hypothetical protein